MLTMRAPSFNLKFKRKIVSQPNVYSIQLLGFAWTRFNVIILRFSK